MKTKKLNSQKEKKNKKRSKKEKQTSPYPPKHPLKITLLVVLLKLFCYSRIKPLNGEKKLHWCFVTSTWLIYSLCKFTCAVWGLLRGWKPKIQAIKWLVAQPQLVSLIPRIVDHAWCISQEIAPSCGKVMFSVTCVCHSVHRRRVPVEGPGANPPLSAVFPPPRQIQTSLWSNDCRAVGIRLKCILLDRSIKYFFMLTGV